MLLGPPAEVFGTLLIGVLAGGGAGVLLRRSRTARATLPGPAGTSPDRVLLLLRELSGFLESGGDPHSVLELVAKRLCDGVFESCVIEIEPDRGPKPLAVVECPEKAAPPERTITVPIISRGMVFGSIALGTAVGASLPELKELAAEVGSRIGGYVHRLRLEQELTAAQQVKSDFLAVMSHELKTPLNIILGYADLLLVGLPVAIPQESRPHLERLRGSARDLLARLEEILAFARMDDEPEEAVLERIDVTSIAREVASALRPVAEHRSLTLYAENAKVAVAVTTDRTRLTQILFNLVSNAVRFTNLGSIGIAVRPREDGGAIVTVVDTGIGIAAENLEQIYEPFWQINRSATRTVGGLGLGLSIARSLANSIGAQLKVSSNVGQGTTFVLELPPHAPDNNGTRGA